jgi:Histidine kinase-, DNA gyrase B-, and HSP90-like ATPase.
MYSLFANLIKNALEASPRNEKIIVKLSQDHEWTVSIHNKGAVPPDVRAYINGDQSTGISASRIENSGG